VDLKDQSSDNSTKFKIIDSPTIPGILLPKEFMTDEVNQKALNAFERAILERVARKYPYIKAHIPFLMVDSRQITGVGMYVNFSYSSYPSDLLNKETSDCAIRSDESIAIHGLKYGLAYEVQMDRGRIQFIELVTYGEAWDGNLPDRCVFMQ
jgi:hypothetical protein